MKIAFKYIIPSLFLLSAILLIAEKSSYLIFTVTLTIIGPSSILYVTSIFIDQLNQRKRDDNRVMRSAIIVTSLLSSMSILILLFSAIFQLSGKGVFTALTFGFVILSLITSLIYFLFNYNKLDFYVTAEFLIVLAPCLLLIGTYTFSTRVPREMFQNIAKNSAISQANNNFVEDNFELDSATINTLSQLTRIETEIIEYSGGQLENGELVTAYSNEHFYRIEHTNNRIEEIKKALSDVNIAIEDIEWLDIDQAPNITVADAVLKFELLKNRILINNLNETPSSNSKRQ